ncbi:hypothetical protein EST38_g9114 [Candolleomyces aberdarensis]|uniref:Uncharacterized protein n=1 Tax=Candolleomyces aberdarensis TaxID=2316362 RepID=A0A4Q2DCY6_9AGAR|nr:hypothetical protein EST38_g9114 [Candolleomyces aberdarensis]
MKTITTCMEIAPTHSPQGIKEVVLSEDENNTKFNIDASKIAEFLERDKHIQRTLRLTEETQLATTLE